MFTRIKKSSQIHVPLTILFVDVRGYTSVSELLDTPEVIRLLAHFYEQCGEAVWERDGIVNKLIGDAVLAIFNFPIERDGHVENAVLSAIAFKNAGPRAQPREATARCRSVSVWASTPEPSRSVKWERRAAILLPWVR